MTPAMTMTTRIRLGALLLCSTSCFGQTIRMGTIAPAGTYWHQVLQDTAQAWTRISGGKIKVTIYAGGVQGSEEQMLRSRVLQGMAISGATLPAVDASLAALTVPMLIASWEEYDYILDRVKPRLEQNLNRKGFVVVQWSDAGFVRFFSKQPARTPDDIKKMKLFVNAGDPKTESLLRSFGFNPVTLSANDILPALQTGMIDAFDVPPLFALANQSFGLAKNMLDVKWSPLPAATLIRRETWESIPEELRPRLLDAAHKLGQESVAKIRKLEEEAIATMKGKGLNVIQADPALLAEWERQATASYPKLRGDWAPADIFDEVVRLRDEYRAGRK